MINFDLICEELKNSYCEDNDAMAYDPILMFKLLLLKVFYPMSDRDLIERAKTDLLFKYFMDIAPEGDVSCVSSLSKFRKLRLKGQELLDKLISETIKISISKGIIDSKTIIVDSTH